MGSGVQCSQRLQHTQQAVGGRQLQVFLWDIADLSAAVSGLEIQKINTDDDDGEKSNKQAKFSSKLSTAQICGGVAHLDPVLHVSIVNDLQDFLLLDGQFVWLRCLETNKQDQSVCLYKNKMKKELHLISCRSTTLQTMSIILVAEFYIQEILYLL